MDYFVHINDGTEEVKPIVLRLLPGEETIFELRVVNHGDPSNISVDASPPLIKAMRLKRSNHYVESEEVIPVLARMPDNTEKVDGELLVTSESGTSRIPISLISEEEAFRGEDNDGEEDGEESLEIKNDYDGYEDEDDEVGSESEEIRDTDADSSGGEAYQNYRSPTHRIGSSGDWIAPEHREARNYVASVDNEGGRSWSDPGSSRGSQEYGQANVGEREAPYYSNESDCSSGEGASNQSPDEDAEEEETRGGLFGLDIVSEQIVPILMFVLIIVVLALTFYSSTIPEFLGALTSSILIVTLIIYGAATLLKA